MGSLWSARRAPNAKSGAAAHLAIFKDPLLAKTSGWQSLQPGMSDPSGWKILKGSPAQDKGLDVGLTSDYFGTAIPQGVAADIGAHELVVPVADAGLVDAGAADAGPGDAGAADAEPEADGAGPEDMGSTDAALGADSVLVADSGRVEVRQYTDSSGANVLVSSGGCSMSADGAPLGSWLALFGLALVVVRLRRRLSANMSATRAYPELL